MSGGRREESKFWDKLITKNVSVLFQAHCKKRPLFKPNQRILGWEKHLWKRILKKGKGGRQEEEDAKKERSYKKEDKEEIEFLKAGWKSSIGRWLNNFLEEVFISVTSLQHLIRNANYFRQEV